MMRKLESLRREIDALNLELLKLLNTRGELVSEIQRIKSEAGIPTYCPDREEKILSDILKNNKGPFPNRVIIKLFKEILSASVQLMETQSNRRLAVSRDASAQDLVIRFENGAAIGDDPVLIAGPCSVEDEKQMHRVAERLVERKLSFIRGGAYKPRSSPYSFQGLGKEGLVLLSKIAKEYNLISITEVMDPRNVGLVSEYSDILQIGARNMHNYDLLREVGKMTKPVLLKRGLSATLSEFLWSAEYIASEGNTQVILCERGIRTFAKETRNTLDISAIPILRQKSFLPVIVDVSHAAGRKDILAPLAKASIAAGAKGVMVEVHPFPAIARSDSEQQLDLDEFDAFVDALDLKSNAIDDVEMRK